MSVILLLSYPLNEIRDKLANIGVSDAAQAKSVRNLINFTSESITASSRRCCPELITVDLCPLFKVMISL